MVDIAAINTVPPRASPVRYTVQLSVSTHTHTHAASLPNDVSIVTPSILIMHIPAHKSVQVARPFSNPRYARC